MHWSTRYRDALAAMHRSTRYRWLPHVCESLWSRRDAWERVHCDVASRLLTVPEGRLVAYDARAWDKGQRVPVGRVRPGDCVRWRHRHDDGVCVCALLRCMAAVALTHP